MEDNTTNNVDTNINTDVNTKEVEDIQNNNNNSDNNNGDNNNDNKFNNKKFLIMYIILIVISVILVILSIINLVLMSKNNNKEDLDKDKVEDIAPGPDSEENLEIIEENKAGKDNTFSEEEVTKFLAERGIQGRITTFYDINGNEFDEKTISPTSKEKHPTYSLMYREEVKNSIWNVLVIGKEITAYPFGYNAEHSSEILNAVLESDLLISYDKDKNKFLKTTPNKDQLLVTKVDKIDNKTLEELSKTKFYYEQGEIVYCY